MLRALLVRLPVHAGGALVEHLHAIAAAVALARIRIARKHHRQRDEAAAVLRPAVQNRKVVQREIVAPDHFLARAAGHDLRKERAHLGQLRQHLQLADQPFRHCAFQITPRCAPATSSGESTSSAICIRFVAGERVDQHRHVRALRLLEQQRRTAVLHAAVGELGDLQVRIDFKRNALQFAVLFQRADEVAQVVIGHKSSDYH